MSSGRAGRRGRTMQPRPSSGNVTASPAPAGTRTAGLEGMPPLIDPNDVYAADRPGMLSPVVRHDPALVYVPNSGSNTVDVIDQRTFKIVAHYTVGLLPQHVTPSYDLKTLWVDNDAGNSLTPVSPITGRPKYSWSSECDSGLLRKPFPASSHPAVTAKSPSPSLMCCGSCTWS